jgi:hypothetical protein
VVAVARRAQVGEKVKRRKCQPAEVGGGIVEAAAKPMNPNHPLYKPGGEEPQTVALEALGRFVLRVQELERGEVRPAEYERSPDDQADAPPR